MNEINRATLEAAYFEALREMSRASAFAVETISQRVGMIEIGGGRKATVYITITKED